MLETSRPEPDLAMLVWMRGALLHYTRGMEALGSGRTNEARKESSALDKAMKRMPEEKSMEGMHPMPTMSASRDMRAKPARSFMGVAATELRASVLMAGGKKARADAEFAKAVSAERELGYREPPYYIRPVAETEGDALLRAGRNAEAKAAYEAALKERPGSGYPISGIARADAAAGDEAGAKAAYRQMLEAWAHGDADLPQVREAKLWMAGHGSGAAVGGH
jgi:predicted Zn-dependent protease